MIRFDLDTRQLLQLTQVSIRHAYYADGLCRDFECVPHADTETAIRNYSLVFKPVESGFMLFYNKSRTSALFRVPAFRPERLTFCLFNRNPRLLNFTETPFPGQDEVFWIHNLKPAGDARDPGLLNGSWRQGGHSKRMRIRGPFALEVPAGAKLSLQDGLGQARPLVQHPGEPPRIDLGDLPAGPYTLLTDGKKPLRYDLYWDPSPAPTPWAYVDLYVDAPEGRWKLAGDADVQPNDYWIYLDARKTFWRYHFISNTLSTYTAHEILHPDVKGVEFSKPETIRLQNGHEAVRLTARNPLPLREIPDFRLELKAKKNGKGPRTVMHLPVPAPDLITPDSAQPDRMYSDLYLNL